MFKIMEDSKRRKSICQNGIGLFAVSCAVATMFMLSLILYTDDGTELETKVVKTRQEVLESGELLARRLPQAIIIGSRKSGTRALLKFLTLNPNIRPASKEVHFFDREHNYRRGLDWYREQMPLSLAHQITIEKSPAYFVTREAPERIRAMNSSIKLILVVRNPVTRLISDFSQLLAHKSHRELGSNRDYDDYYHLVLSDEASISGDTFKAIASTANSTEQLWSQAETSFESYVRRSDGGVNEQRRAVRASMYSDYLERWLAHFNRDQLHVVDGEKLISDPASELRQVESYLGLEPVITSADFIFNQTKGFFCLAARNFSSWDHSIDNLDRRKRETNRASYASSAVCLGNDKGRRHVRVKRNLTRELEQFYSPFNEYLYSLVGRDFNWSTEEIK